MIGRVALLRVCRGASGPCSRLGPLRRQRGFLLRLRRPALGTSWVAALLLSTGCDSNAPAGPQPTDVAHALFRALRAGQLEPLVPFLPTEEDLAGADIQGMSAIHRERRSAEIAYLHKTLGVDWTTAELSSLQVRSEPDGFVIGYRIRSTRAEAVVEIRAARRGSRLVVATLHIGADPVSDGQR